MAEVKAEDVRRAREALMEQGIPLEVTYMNHAYETLRWELAPVLAAYAAAETERLTQELLERTTQRNLAREARENWGKRAKAAEKLQELTLQNEIRWMQKAEAAEAERDRLASGLEVANSELRRIAGEPNRLRKALEKYGEHEEACDYHADAIEKFCTCGLRAALQDSASSREGE